MLKQRLLEKSLNAKASSTESWLKIRYYQVLISIYLHNEYRGYIELESLYQSCVKRLPNEDQLIKAIKKHAEDEKKHYFMFCHFLKTHEISALRVPASFGYVDLFIEHVFGQKTSSLEHSEILKDPKKRASLFRMIMMTEKRGLKQVRSVLKQSVIQKNKDLVRLFRVIEADEPSHFNPYEEYLVKHQRNLLTKKEMWIDRWIHYSLMLLKLPYLFLAFWTKPLPCFPHEAKA